MIKKEEVKHIADLARIGVSDEEVEKFSADLSSILNWMEKLSEVDVSKVAPTTRAIGAENIIREDKVAEFENKKGLTEMFPEEKSGYDRVKSVL